MSRRDRPTRQQTTWISTALMLLVISTSSMLPTLSYADDLTRCRTSLKEANSIASGAVLNAEKAAELTKACTKREEDCKKQRDDYRAQGEAARTERDNLAGENVELRREGTRYRAELAGLRLSYDELKRTHDAEWSPTTWAGIGAGSAVVAVLLLKFVVAPRLGLD